MCTLTLPDICCAADSDDGKATGDRYAAWFDAHVSPKYRGRLDGKTCYKLRCGVLHQGRSTPHHGGKYSRIVFVVSKSKNESMIHNNVFDDALNLDIDVFCGDVIDSVRLWFGRSDGSEAALANRERIMRQYAAGDGTFSVGVDVIK